MEDIELRVHPSEFRINDELLLVEGLVNKTEEWSHLLGTNKKFKEKIKSGAFKRAIEKAKAIDFLAEHNPKYLLSSTANDSLELWEDEEGLKMRAKICPTSYGKDFYALMKSGLLAHMSFGFKIRSQSWKKKIDGTFERIVSDLDLIEVSAVRNPAYPQSAISARGFNVVEDVQIDEETLIEERTNENENEELKPASDEVLAQVLSQLTTLNSEISLLKSFIPKKEEGIVKDEIKAEETVKEVEKTENTETKTEEVKEPKKETAQEVEKTDIKQETNEQIKEETPKSPDLSSYYKDLLAIYKKGE